MEQGMEQSTVITGVSGATVELTPTGAVKYAPPALWARLDAQAQYMAEHGAPFARVLGIAQGRYWMERLQPLPTTTASTQLLLFGAEQSLRPLWARPAHLDADWAALHLAYVESLCALHNLPKTFDRLWSDWHNIAPLPLTVCTTHGDATLDNMLLAEDGSPRWVDPLPASGVIPPLLAVDLGKLLQSADGYELRKYGSGWGPAVDHAVVLEGHNEWDVLAARYFRAVAYLRMLRYVRGENLDYAQKEMECYTCLT